MKSEHKLFSCDCKSGHRTLVLMAKDFPANFPDLLTFNNQDWNFHPAFGVIQVEVGTGRHWSGAAEVCNFLQGVLGDKNRLNEIKAVWVKSHQSLAEQLMELIYNAEPILAFAPTESSEMLEILQSRRIETWFQPVIKAGTGAIWGYECLMRGRTADNSLVGALQMLEWARAENLTFMLDRVCREIHLENAGKLNFGEDCKFLINFLPTAIYQPEFCLQSSLAAARRSGIVPAQVIFEVVETDRVIDHEHLRRILEFYRNAGFGVALDDMGSGYAGLTLLADLQPDLIKIDREIISKSIDSKYHRDICASLVRLGKENGQLVLAEGIETEAEKSLMNRMGVDFFQGYLFGKPAPIPLPFVSPQKIVAERILAEEFELEFA